MALYVGLSFANSPEGYLGTDTGGKVVTLQAIETRGSVGHLDVGYWAESWDPAGDLHGYWGTLQNDDGAWVQVTTVPLMLAASPLWDAGGYRLTLVLPMLGGALCALAARSLTRRLSGDEAAQELAFWATGLAGPVLLYALDLWEHTLGLAAMAWACVLLAAAAEGETTARRVVTFAAGAGLLWGVAFSMRTEALLYGAFVTAAVCLWLATRRRIGGALLVGAASAVGVAVGVVGNSMLERAVLGGTLRAGRASGTAGGFGTQPGTRLREGLITTFGLDAGTTGVVLGVVAVLALGLLVRRAAKPGWKVDRPDVTLGALAVVPVVLGFMSGLAFIPGMLIASPLAVAGLVLGLGGRAADGGATNDRSRLPARVLALAAVAALPAVWAFQYVGGAGPQWGGRYVLLSAFLLTVVGALRLASVDIVVRRIVVAAAVLVTAFGFTWMVVRTNGFASAGHELAAIDEPVLIAKDSAGFLPREFVAENGDRRWLATLGNAELERAVDIVGQAGFRRFGLVVIAGSDTPDHVGGMHRVDTTRIEIVSGASIDVVRYER
ncbi:MAG: hypothetical protein KDB02_14655 [Acidimicrobiales bacterium]|nr:hypothetical protein [Acidimicrobiales bacterium]